MTPNDDRWQSDQRMLDKLIESVLEASEEEILEDARAEGVDIGVVAAEFRASFDEVLRRVRLETLRKAQAEWESSSLKGQDLHAILPPSASERRTLLERVLATFPGQYELTLQYRDFRELADEDVESCLRTLAALGALDRPELGEGES